MKQLTPPDLDAKNVFTTIKDKSKNEKKRILHNWEEYVFERYGEYETSVYNLEDMSNSGIIEEKDKSAFTSCYSRNSKGYLEGEVVAKIISVQSIQHKQKCPYCGIDKPRTIDHYLPKSIFPEFSIYPPNLIPCCGYCNNKKNNDWLVNGKRSYINLYFDELPRDKQYLFTTFEYEKNSLVPNVYFTIENRDNINSELFELINRHYSKLHLLSEFSEAVDEQISNIIDEITHNKHLTTDDHKESLNRKYQTNVRKYGLNYWMSSFLKTLINCEEFFRKCYSI